MHFPGSKLLSQDISTESTPLEAFIQNCEQVNLSGYVEITFGDSEGLILFYLGEQINIIYRTGSDIFVSNDAVLKLRNMTQLRDGKMSVYELPLDMAHMLRGLSNRQEVFSQIFAPDPLRDLLKKLEADGHTGSLEVLTNKGTGIVLLVRGRVSNAYFETEGGVTFEKGEALKKVFELLERPEISARVFQSEFSPDIWKARHENQRARFSRLHELLEQARPSSAPLPGQPSGPASAAAEPPRPAVKDRLPIQKKLLAEIRQQTPSMLAGFFFNLDTEEILAELVDAPAKTAERLIVDKLPALVKYLENLAAMRGDDHVESLALTTENFYLIVKSIPEAGEGMALITDKSQPVTLASALLLNSSHRYLGMISGTLAGNK